MDEEKANNFVRGRIYSFFFVAFCMTRAYVTIDYGHTQERPLRVTVPQLTIFVINNNQQFLSF